MSGMIELDKSKRKRESKRLVDRVLIFHWRNSRTRTGIASDLRSVLELLSACGCAGGGGGEECTIYRN